MSRKIHNKLVRDKIPEIIKKKGEFPRVSILADGEYWRALKLKTEEEAKELIDAETVEEVLDELVDLQELIGSIAKNYGISAEQLENARKKKVNERGGFEERFLLEYVDDPKK